MMAGDEPVDSLLEVHIRGQVQFHEVLEGVVDESRAVVKRVGEELHQLLHIVGLVASEFVSAADGVVELQHVEQSQGDVVIQHRLAQAPTVVEQ